jgi:hypothetical protein
MKVLNDDKDMDFNIDIIVELYIVNDLEDPIVIELYKLANKTLNLSIKDNTDIFIIQLIKAICKDSILKLGIIDRSTTKKVNRPKISKKELFEKFRDLFDLSINKKSIPEIINEMKELNHKISLMTDEKIFGNNIKKTHLLQKEKAKKIKFYLNMKDSKYTPEKWILSILNNK